MTKRATFTQAELERAFSVAEKRGWRPYIERGRICFERGDVVIIPPEAEGPCDDLTEINRAFGCDT